MKTKAKRIEDFKNDVIENSIVLPRGKQRKVYGGRKVMSAEGKTDID